MAIQFVGGATAQKTGATSGNTTIALNSGLTGGIASSVSAGDLVLAAFATGSTANRTLAITSGYTLIGSELYQDDTFDTNLRIAYKFMGATPDDSTTFGPTGSISDAGAMAVYVFRGVDPTTPLDVAAVPGQGASTSRVVPPDITPSTAGAFVVVAGAAAHNGGTDTFTSSDLTDFLTRGGNDSNDVTLGIGHDPSWASGATNYATWGHSQTDSTSFSWCAITIALRPEAAVPVTHATSGVLAGAGAAVDGAASSATTRPSSGALEAGGAAVDGIAARTRVHTTSGVLLGAGATIAGTAARTRQHDTDGVLAGAGSEIAGEAAREGAPVTHATSGALGGPGSIIVGAAARERLHGSSGVLLGQASTVSGTASRTRQHATSGALIAQGTIIVGAAAHHALHVSSGVLVGQGATVVGAAAGSGDAASASSQRKFFQLRRGR